MAQPATTVLQASPGARVPLSSPYQSSLPTRLVNGNEERGHDGRPSKRQRTEEQLSPNREPSHDQKPDRDRDRNRDRERDRERKGMTALKKCLEGQIFPHIERATARLSPDIYDLDKLGATIVRKLINAEFQRNFDAGQGRLTSAVEGTIAAGIHRLVTELTSGLEFRRSTTHASSTATPDGPSRTNTYASTVILPSIETEIDLGAEDDGIGSEDEGEDNNDDDDNDVVEYGENDVTEDIEIIDEDEEEIKNEEADDDGDDGDNGGAGDKQNEEDDPVPLVTSPVQPRSPHTPRRRRRRPPKQPITPQQARVRAKAGQWQSGKSYNSARVSKPSYRFGLPIRPYVPEPARHQIISGISKTLVSTKFSAESGSNVFHVDFSEAEIQYLQYVARKLYGKPAAKGERSTLRDLRNVLKKMPSTHTSLPDIHARGYVGDYDRPPPTLATRSSACVASFLSDLYAKKLNPTPTSLFIEHKDSVAQSETQRANTVPKLLLSREIIGNRLGPGAARTYQNFRVTVKSNREDYLEPQAEWTNCAGDIMTISWLSNIEFVCGTTTHSDAHNQQYNKPGNLLLGSAIKNTLCALPGHRIVRPVVSSGENALDSMVASQDPWLFTSVVSSDYDPSCDLSFTSSFDKTVKVWEQKDGTMRALGTWEHTGHVNFVVTSKNGTGIVATAADVPSEAVRVYRVDRHNISGSRFDSYSCTRIHDEDYVPSEKWAYYPAALRWGLASSVNHLLLIGYSPRSPTGEDHLIPEEKLNTGELCLWDTLTKTQVKVNSAKGQNVFEVAWHPTRSSFAAATSASKVLERTELTPRTQIRIFEFNKETGQYGAVKTLDCSAMDINELAMMPNSSVYSYVTAGCTDGNVYVWDTARSDLPMCILAHGDPIEELLGNREEEDVGVKFVAWATTADRLYTGSSDGVVKVWNIRHGKGVLIKDLIEVAAPITCGAFSPDFTRLVVGDGSGRVYLLALENPEDEDPVRPPSDVAAGFLNVHTDHGQRAIRRPRPFIPHAELPPPGAAIHNEVSSILMEGQQSARQYLQAGQLELHPDKRIGPFQGLNYAETGLYRAEAHVDEDPHGRLLPKFEWDRETRQQRRHYRTYFPVYYGEARTDTVPKDLHSTLNNGLSDSGNRKKEPGYQETFDRATWLELRKEKAELDDRLFDLDYETSIPDSDEERGDDEMMD
ncbi:WD40 repeat-like protein [Nemania sp. FL0916]|nr:WD40 repeat-like protein [Nemania sp. FL0916]